MVRHNDSVRDGINASLNSWPVRRLTADQINCAQRFVRVCGLAVPCFETESLESNAQCIALGMRTTAVRTGHGLVEIPGPDNCFIVEATTQRGNVLDLFVEDADEDFRCAFTRTNELRRMRKKCVPREHGAIDDHAAFVVTTRAAAAMRSNGISRSTDWTFAPTIAIQGSIPPRPGRNRGDVATPGPERYVVGGSVSTMTSALTASSARSWSLAAARVRPPRSRFHVATRTSRFYHARIKGVIDTEQGIVEKHHRPIPSLG